MRLKEPMQSIKTLNGHVVMHMAMFIVSFNVDYSRYYNRGESVPKEEGGELYKYADIEMFTFKTVRWGHLVSALALITSYLLKCK